MVLGVVLVVLVVVLVVLEVLLELLETQKPIKQDLIRTYRAPLGTSPPTD